MDQFEQMMKQFEAMLIGLGKNKNKLDMSGGALKGAREKGGNECEAMLKALVKTYSDDALYRPINNTITKGQYEKL